MNAVLVVAEDKDSGVLLKHLLEAYFGCAVVTASVRGVTQAVRSIQFDLVVVDCITSVQRGVEVVQQLEDSGSHVPVVFYSADASEGGLVQIPGRHIPLVVKPNFKDLLRSIGRQMDWQTSKPGL